MTSLIIIIIILVAGLLEEPGRQPSQLATRTTACCTPGELEKTINTTKMQKIIHKQTQTNIQKTNAQSTTLIFVQGAAGATSEEIQFRHKRVWGYVYRWGQHLVKLSCLFCLKTKIGAFIFIFLLRVDVCLEPPIIKHMYEEQASF